MARLEIHFLDVGPIKYGDCILIQHDDQAILIDAGHKRDFDGVDRFASIPEQLDELLQGERPHRIDLLVLTHCHDDHIGCMPELVARGVIDVRSAYLADPALGWGEGRGGPDTLLDARTQALLGVLREEGAAMLRPSELPRALADAGGLRSRLNGMIEEFEQAEIPLAFCTGDEDRAAIEAEFSGIGLKILGPTAEHLLLCNDQIAEEGRDALRDLAGLAQRDAGLSDVAILEQLIEARRAQADSVLIDAFGTGAALNCQSILLALNFAGRKVLLTGDMQFADDQVQGLDDEMRELRDAVKNHGPYDVVKTAHHTANNGWSVGVGSEQLRPAGSKAFIVHTGGQNDAAHPAPRALGLLKELNRNRPDDVEFLRTDRNGLISFFIDADGRVRYVKRRGRRDDFTPNRDAPLEPVIAGSGTGAVVEQLPPRADGVVEVITRIPTSGAKVTVTIEVDPTSAPTARVASEPAMEGESDPRIASFSLAGGRALPPLLFVTDEQGLARKIGRSAARTILDSIRRAGQTVFTGRLSQLGPVEAAALVRGELNRHSKSGVVLLGGPEVVPAQRLDTLGFDLRGQLEDPAGDPDEFIVWNDELYVDTDNDLIPEIPVSRIPDGGEAAVVVAALKAPGGDKQSRFGVRNVRRPFANAVFQQLTGSEGIRVSAPVRSTQILPRDAQRDFAYLMLHGDDADGVRFWGELNGDMLEAFSVAQIPSQFQGVVLTGCCWGALLTSKRALFCPPDSAIQSRVRAGSIAISFLAAGAQAFVGCTGVHYSPGGNQPTTAGGPMQTAFIRHWKAGEPPARALFLAKADCLQSLPDESDPEELAIALKIIRQYACLGLGW